MKKVTITIALVAVSLALVLGLYLGCAKESEDGKITLAAQKTIYNSLIYVASAKDYWGQEGLDITLKEFVVGKLCLEAVITGNADVGAVSDFPVALAGLSKLKFFVIATMAWGDGDVRIIARKDHGISLPADLQGKTVATFLGTAPEFYFRRFLQKHSIDSEGIKVVNMRPGDMVTALTKGDIDASVIWEPFGYHVEKQLEDNAIVFAEEGLYDIAHVLVANQEFSDENPQAVQAMLRALLKAERFIRDNHAEAVQIIAEATDLQPEVVEGIWSNYRFGLTLDKVFVEQLNAIAKWAVETGITPKDAQIPDYRGLIYEEGLKGVKPTGVSF